MATDQIIAKIRPVLLRYGIKRADLFGSAARSEMRLGSDVDVLVELPETATLLDLGGLYMDLKEVLGGEVDVVEYEAVHPYIKKYVFEKTVQVI